MSSNPATGSKNALPTGKFSILRFRVSDCYDERELEELLEELDGRGAHYRSLSELSDPGWFELAVPEDFPWEPYRATLWECNSVDRVSNVIQMFCRMTLQDDD